ncbi:MAG: pilus assembly protein PilP [Pseudobdellovibrionaceae bacterium]
MKLTRWVITYIVMASVGLWMALFMSLRFMTPAYTQTPSSPPPSSSPEAKKLEPPSSGDLPPEFAQDSPQGKIPPPPTEPPVAKPAAAAPPPPPPAAAAPTEAPPSVPVAEPLQGMGEASAVPVVPQFATDDQYSYDPTGHRDPFKPYKSFRPVPSTPIAHVKASDSSDPLQKWDLDRFAVVAIIWEVRLPKAMVKDPDGKTFMISKNTKIGRNGGQVVAIREGEVVVVEAIENEGVQTKEVKILELKK